jgi:hypothetical protein
MTRKDIREGDRSMLDDPLPIAEMGPNVRIGDGPDRQKNSQGVQEYE